MTYDFSRLDISGYRGSSLPNTFVRQSTPARHLGILLPGVAYSTDMPLLYYARAVLLALGANTFNLEVNYLRLPGYRTAPAEEQYRWLAADATAAAGAALDTGPYERVTLVAKSLGTLALGHLVSTDARLARADCVWLTPLLKQDRLAGQIKAARPRSLFVAGGADGQHDPARQAEVTVAVDGQVVVIDGADHSLEIPGDVEGSLRCLGRVIEAVQAFLAG